MEQKKHLYKKNFFANNFAIYRLRYEAHSRRRVVVLVPTLGEVAAAENDFAPIRGLIDPVRHASDRAQ
jgi:hypothetical protein